MPFPLPSPTDILSRMEARAERAVLAAKPDASPAAVARMVRSPRGMFAILLRTCAMELYQAHLHLRWWGDQYFPDTAERAQLERHASVWGIQRRPATRAIGKASVVGATGTPVPAGAVLQGAGDSRYEVISAVTLAGGTATLDVRALDAGEAANAAAGLRLSFVTLVTGLDPQEAVVDAEGLAGGAEIENDASLLARLLVEIRAPAHGGASFDYRMWIQNAFPAVQVRCLPNWVGAGTVGVVVAMGTAAAPRVPITAELEAMAAHLKLLRPVTAELVMVPVALLAQPLTLVVDPYEATVRNAVAAAAAAFFAREALIGEKLYRSRLSEAISAASGEYRHEVTVPVANIAPSLTQLPTLGPITWVAP